VGFAIVLCTFQPTVAHAELLLFGGNNHEIFLGCFDCPKADNNSICNKFGKGSRFATEGIFNGFIEFGARYSDSSPWNRYSTSDKVPVLVDERGEFYGYLTTNKFRSDAVPFAADLLDMYELSEGNLEVVQDMICIKVK
jgi:hypothetical protein